VLQVVMVADVPYGTLTALAAAIRLPLMAARLNALLLLGMILYAYILLYIAVIMLDDRWIY
jgi:hypothetical protein